MGIRVDSGFLKPVQCVAIVISHNNVFHNNSVRNNCFSTVGDVVGGLVAQSSVDDILCLIIRTITGLSAIRCRMAISGQAEWILSHSDGEDDPSQRALSDN